MSRSGYSEDCDNLAMWRGAVASALRGKRGQLFLREMAAALDALPVRELVAGDLVAEDGACCAIGSVAVARKMNVADIDEGDPETVAAAFGIARAMACEIAYENDECGERWEGGKRRDETPAERWQRMRGWVGRQLGEGLPPPVGA